MIHLTSPETINTWVGNKTFNIIDNILDEVDQSTNYYLVNALAIDMEWKNKFLYNSCSIWWFNILCRGLFKRN